MALNPLVSLIGRLLARSGRKRGNRQTDGRNDKTTTVTLATQARRGLMKGTKVLTSAKGVSYTHAIHVYTCVVRNDNNNNIHCPGFIKLLSLVPNPISLTSFPLDWKQQLVQISGMG